MTKMLYSVDGKIDLILNWLVTTDAGRKQYFCLTFGIEHHLKSLFAAGKGQLAPLFPADAVANSDFNQCSIPKAR